MLTSLGASHSLAPELAPAVGIRLASARFEAAFVLADGAWAVGCVREAELSAASGESKRAEGNLISAAAWAAGGMNRALRLAARIEAWARDDAPAAVAPLTAHRREVENAMFRTLDDMITIVAKGEI